MKKNVIGTLLIKDYFGKTLATARSVDRDSDTIECLTRGRVLVDFENRVSAVEVGTWSFLHRLNQPWSELETSVRLGHMLEQLGHRRIWQTVQLKKEDIPGKSQAVKRKLYRELEETLGFMGLCIEMDLDPIKILLIHD